MAVVLMVGLSAWAILSMYVDCRICLDGWIGRIGFLLGLVLMCMSRRVAVLYNNMIDDVMLASTILRNKDIAVFYGVSLPTAIKIKRNIIDDMRASGEISVHCSRLCVYHLAKYEGMDVGFVISVLCSTIK